MCVGFTTNYEQLSIKFNPTNKAGKHYKTFSTKKLHKCPDIYVEEEEEFNRFTMVLSNRCRQLRNNSSYVVSKV